MAVHVFIFSVFLNAGAEQYPASCRKDNKRVWIWNRIYKKRGKRAEITVFLKVATRPKYHVATVIGICVSLFNVQVVAVILEKVMFQYCGNLHKECCVYALALEDAVHIGAVAA